MMLVKSWCNLDELAGAAQAPNLDELLLFDLKQLKPPHVQCFLGHQSLKGLRTDNIAIERALGLSRAGTAKVFEFSAYTPVVPVSKIESAMVGGGDSLVDSTADFVSDEALLDESKQELHVHIRISSEFAKADEWQLCCEIEEHSLRPICWGAGMVRKLVAAITQYFLSAQMARPCMKH